MNFSMKLFLLCSFGTCIALYPSANYESVVTKAPLTPALEYGVPNKPEVRVPSPTYGAPARTRTDLIIDTDSAQKSAEVPQVPSTHYGVPVQRVAVPKTRFTYTVPSVRTSVADEVAPIKPAEPFLTYEVPSVEPPTPHISYGAPTTTVAPVKPHFAYGVPPRASYGVPVDDSVVVARNSLGSSFGAASRTFELPQKPSEEYGVPNVRAPVAEYGVPPSEEYGVPNVRIPATEYGLF